MQNKEKYTGFEIAIIGMACRFPGAANWREYWNNLVNGVESIRFFSREELLALGIDAETIDDKNFVPANIRLDRKEFFDSFFFNYRPDDAALMNPEHRIFHECAWEALEDAGYDPDKTNVPIGVIAGAGEDLNWKIYSMLKNQDQHIDGFTLGQLNNKDYLPTLLSYKLNLKGPSISVNTACSTSLMAVHLGCRSLLLGDAKMILAGGVTIKTFNKHGYSYEEGMILSADGHCKTFDAEASGTIGGEGAGIVVLKRLKDALADGDQIHAVIKGSAINNDGSRKLGFTAPSVEGQLECIRMAQKFARVEPQTIGYVEAHGTGTKLGDPIEVEALNIAFGKAEKKYCALGAVKTNFGHLDTAAGVAGLIKTVLCLKFRQIPPTLHFKNANPEIDLAQGPFYINTETKQWQNEQDAPLRAAVSSFGIGGTNAHVVLEEAPTQDEYAASHDYKLVTLSARTENSLRRYGASLLEWLQANDDIHVANLAYTSQAGRKAFEYRKAIVCKEKADLVKQLADDTFEKNITKINNRSLVFMFPGQGSQYVNMCAGLYGHEPAFRQVMDRGFDLLAGLTGADCRKILFSPGETTALINETRYTQPLLFLLEYALARLLMSYGILPQYMIGHSIGEYVAACISGVFSFEDGLKLVTRRGELMYELPQGSMISVSMTAEEAGSLVSDHISIAAINAPGQVVLSGNTDSINELADRLEGLGVVYVKLHTSHAFHSHMQEPVMEAFKKELEKVQFGAIQIPFISNLTGSFANSKKVCTPDYWVQHLRKTVKFADGVHTLLAQDQEMIFVEVGPGHSLGSLVKQLSPDSNAAVLNLVRHPKQTDDDRKLLTECIGRLWSLGTNIDWQAYYGAEKRCRISMPTYAFENIKYPVEVDLVNADLPFTRELLPGNNSSELKDWLYYPVWKNAVINSAAAPGPAKGYLFFSDASRTCNSLKASIAAGSALVEVLQGEYYTKKNDNQFVIDATNPHDYFMLVEDLLQQGFGITDIVYCWSLNKGQHELKLDPHEAGMHLLFFGLANIVKALLAHKLLTERRVFLLTDRLYHVTGNETILPSQALTKGLMNVLPQEYSVTCCTIDVDTTETDTFLFERIAAEIKESAPPRIVALRYGKRWLPEYQRNHFSLDVEKNILQGDKVYLVTGGAGNLGLVLTDYLLKHYGAKVVWIGRKKSVPDRIMPGVVYYPADIASADELENTVRDIELTLGPVAGVFHAAGVTDHKYFELVQDLSPENAFPVLSPKVSGIENIFKVFSQRQPDFVLVTSSLASTLGGISYGSYSAANLYMDHFTWSICNQYPHWKSIQFGELLFNAEAIAKQKKGNRTALKPVEICKLVEWVLHTKDVPVIIQTVPDLAGRLDKVYEKKKDIYLDQDDKNEIVKKERPSLRNSYVAPSTDIEKEIVIMLEEFFGIDKIGIADNFFELGGDSLKATIFIRKIEQVFKIKLSLAGFFQAERIQQICEEIEEKVWINKSSGKEIVSII